MSLLSTCPKWAARSGLILALVTLSLTGCTLASLGGKFADWYAMRSIDEQVDLTNDQRTYLQPRVKGHVHWLKKELLPVVASAIDDLVLRVEKDGVSAADIAWLEERIDEYKSRIYERIQDDTLWLLSSLSPAQLKYMEEQRTDRRETADERLDVKEEAYRKGRFDRYEEICERWLGTISAEQRQLIHKTLAPLATIQHAKIYEDGRATVSERLIAAATPPVDRDKLGTFVADWVRDPASLRPDVPEKQYRERMQLFRDLILALWQTMTPAQSKHFIGELRKLQERIRDFAAT